MFSVSPQVLLSVFSLIPDLLFDCSCVVVQKQDSFAVYVQAAMMIWVLFLPFFLDSLLVTVSGFIKLLWLSCYFNLSSLQILGSTWVYPC